MGMEDGFALGVLAYWGELFGFGEGTDQHKLLCISHTQMIFRSDTFDSKAPQQQNTQLSPLDIWKTTHAFFFDFTLWRFFFWGVGPFWPTEQ